jgi:hypothetical protein
MKLIEQEKYLVKLTNGEIRIARFNGFGENKGWGGMDWSGDCGGSTDSWMHSEVEWWLPLDCLYIEKGEDKSVLKIGINQI